MDLEVKKLALINHPAYENLHSLEGLRLFMETHVFAVWDFMSLLKSLQLRLTSTELSWKPSSYNKKVVRLINEIVLGEESDVLPNLEYSDHFSLYLKAMHEVGANTCLISDFLETLDFALLPPHIRQFVEYNINLAKYGEVHQVASAFFHGREGLIPSMFTEIKDVLKQNKIEAPTFIYYLERHIELDSFDHGPAGEELLEMLYNGQEELVNGGRKVAFESLRRRQLLWDGLL